MLLSKPQVQLFHRVEDGSNVYYLHAVTFFMKTNWRADGHEIVKKKGKLSINLHVTKDEVLPTLTSLNPIVHTIKLGKLPKKIGTGEIPVNLYETFPPTLRTKKKKLHTSITMSTDAEPDQGGSVGKK